MINMKKMNKKQAGFTLIELVMVIVILGILSAFALPRFADLTGDAREASLSGLAGALKSAAAISHSQWIADGSPTTAPVTVELEGADIAITEGYPTSAIAGITLAANVDIANDYDVVYVTTATPPTATYTIPNFTPTSAGDCQVVYEEATATSIYTVTFTDGC